MRLKMTDQSGLKCVAIAAAVILLALFAGCATVQQLSSFQRLDNIIIDGNGKEWEHVPAYAGEGKFTLAVVNDSEYLYLCLSTRDPQMEMQMLAAGLTVWLDGEGGTDKTFGIKFPIGMRPGGMLALMNRENKNEASPELREVGPQEFEIVGQTDKHRARYSLNEIPGLRLCIARSNEGVTAYELQVPLRRTESHPFAVGLRASTRVGLGIELGKIEMPEGERRGAEGGPPGGSTGEGPPSGGGPPTGGGARGGMGRAPGGRGMRGGEGPVQGRPGTEGLNLWFAVVLSVPQR